jgi:hypothetical protein
METENKIVEYVECIKGDGNESYNIVGDIYKVKDYNPITGALYLYVHNHSIGNIFFGEESKIRYNNTDYKISTKWAFENHILKQQEMKTITYNQAQQIIDIACSRWKEKLFTLWGKNIVLKQEITISEESYKEMRNACTDEQNTLFDEIFGKDIKFIPEGTPCLVRDCDSESWRLSYSNGDGRFKMANGTITKWKHVKVLDINNLPTY